MSVRAFALIPAGWWLQHHLRVRRHDQRAASYAQTRASNWLSPPRRSRRGQCDGERITKQHHEREQGSRARCQCRRQAIQPRSGWARLPFRCGGGPARARKARSASRAAKVPAALFRSPARRSMRRSWLAHVAANTHRRNMKRRPRLSQRPLRDSSILRLTSSSARVRSSGVAWSQAAVY
jgi:hypothetical protein